MVVAKIQLIGGRTVESYSHGISSQPVDVVATEWDLGHAVK
jgi:hypothetical protein